MLYGEPQKRPDVTRYMLGQQVKITCSEETGIVIARCERLSAEPQYLIRYRAADGRAVQCWWDYSAISVL